MERDLLLMLLDLEHLLGGKGKPTKDTVEGAIKKINSINDLMLKYISSKDRPQIPAQLRGMKDYVRIKERLSATLDENNMAAFLDNLPAEVDPEEAAIAVSEVMPKLKAIIPLNSSVTLTGIDERLPSDYEQSKFIRQIRILEDPLSILPLIESDAVTGTEVDALKLFYPSLYEVLVGAIVNALADYAGKSIEDKPATLPLIKNRTLSLILGVPRVSPKQMAMFQSPAQDSEKQDIKTPASQAQTDLQRVAQK